MDRNHTLNLVREIRMRLDECKIGIRWASSEMLASSAERRSNRKGPGEEHDAMKVYEPGDDLKHINVLATVASSDPDEIIINTYFEPRIVSFDVLLDVNSSMNFGTKGTLKSRLAALCAACGIQSAGKLNDRVSFVNFTCEPVTIRKNQGGSRVLTDFLIHALEDGTVPAEDAPVGGGFASAFRALGQKHRSITLVVSDFINMSDDDWEALRISGFRNDTIAVYVQDIRERELPEVPWPGASYSFEDYRGVTKTIWVTPDNPPSWLAWLSNGIAAVASKFGAGSATSRTKYNENFKRREAEILERLTTFGIKTVVVSTEDEANGVRNVLRLLANKTR